MAVIINITAMADEYTRHTSSCLGIELLNTFLDTEYLATDAEVFLHLISYLKVSFYVDVKPQ